jgi:hypothetical protein
MPSSCRHSSEKETETRRHSAIVTHIGELLVGLGLDRYDLRYRCRFLRRRGLLAEAQNENGKQDAEHGRAPLGLGLNNRQDTPAGWPTQVGGNR